MKSCLFWHTCIERVKINLAQEKKRRAKFVGRTASSVRCRIIDSNGMICIMKGLEEIAENGGLENGIGKQGTAKLMP